MGRGNKLGGVRCDANNLKCFITFKHYVAPHRPYPSHLRETRFVAVLHCAVVPMIDVLLRILPGEMDAVVRLTHVVRTCLAGMPVGHVKTA
jgi:hypothetical protein